MDFSFFLSLVILLGIILMVFFYRFNRLFGIMTIATVLISEYLINGIPLLFFLVSTILLSAIAAFILMKATRRRLVIKPFFNFLRKKMPKISDTERDALQAGHTWWEKSLFSGAPYWPTLFSMPKPQLTAEEESFINNQVEQLCQMLDDWQIVHRDADLSPAVWDYLKKEKFFGMVIAKQYGGLGFSALAHSSVVTKIATRSISAAVNTMVPNSLGPAELLTHYGTDEQKKYYLPRLATGEEIPCFGLTATDAGSDAGSIPDVGVIEKGIFNDQEIIGIRLNFDKRYITLAPVATVIGVAFRLFDPHHLIGDQHCIGLTLCLIPASHEGVTAGNRHYPLKLAFMNGPVRGKDVFIPLDWIIGGIEKAGQGWRMLMECLSIGRSISLPALSTACSKVVYQQTGAYARIRHQFNVPIAQFEGIEEVLATIAGMTYLLEATRVFTVGAVDQHMKPSIASAIAKYHMTEMARLVISCAMDVHAGHAIQTGPKNELANLHFAGPISITVEGANILTRNLIIFGQGAIRCHPYLLKEVEILSEEQNNVAALDDVLMLHIGYHLQLLAKNFIYGLTGGAFIASNLQQVRLKRLHRQLTRMSAALALASDVSLILLGGSLKRRERISARLGDVLSQLYLASAALKYFHDHQCPREDIESVRWCLHTCLYKMQEAFDGIFSNYPNKFIAVLLKWIIFPWGKPYHKPSDKLDHQLAKGMLVPSSLRERLLALLNIKHPIATLRSDMEKAIDEIANMEVFAKRVQKFAQMPGKQQVFFSSQEKIDAALKEGILTSDEARQLTAYEALRMSIINVDEFSFDLKRVVT